MPSTHAARQVLDTEISPRRHGAHGVMLNQISVSSVPPWLIPLFSSLSDALNGAERKAARHFGPAAGNAAQREIAAERMSALAHSEEAEAPLLGPLARPDPVV